VDVDPTAAEAFIMSGFVHRLAVMGCVQEDPPSGLAISHERKATASFTAATQLGVKNLRESIGMMESEIQRAPKVRVIIEAFARSQPMQQVMAKQQPGGSSKVRSDLRQRPCRRRLAPSPRRWTALAPRRGSLTSTASEHYLCGALRTDW